MWLLTTLDAPAPAYARRVHPPLNGGSVAEAAPAVDRTELPRTHVLLLGFEPNGRADLCAHLKRARAFVSWSYETGKLTGDPRGCGAFDAVIVNLDAFEKLETGVDALLSFRAAYPVVGVVLVSAHVARDELGAHRKAICDGTLRYPVTSDRLSEALRVALRHRQDRGAPTQGV